MMREVNTWSSCWAGVSNPAICSSCAGQREWGKDKHQHSLSLRIFHFPLQKALQATKSHPSHGVNHPQHPHRVMAHVNPRPSATALLLSLSQAFLPVRTPKSKGISQNKGVSGWVGGRPRGPPPPLPPGSFASSFSGTRRLDEPQLPQC